MIEHAATRVGRVRFPAIAVAVVAALTVGCGSDDSSSEPATSATAPSAEETNAAADTGLVGEWRTENVCEDQLQAFRDAGLDDFVSEWVSDYPGLKPTDSDPCHGANPIKHSHGFGANGSFASYDPIGRQVDDGRYVAVDDRTLTLGDPPVTVHYRIEGDKATFDVVVPDCKSKRCLESAAYVTSVFFPRTYQRVR
jgi:hypothetical protein